MDDKKGFRTGEEIPSLIIWSDLILLKLKSREQSDWN
jgi:hypothetical protein